MPTYEYNCVNCGDMEIFHSIKDQPHEICPQCHSAGMTRLISAGAGFIVKGKQANQYNDVKFAKYWRDKDGNRHPVTAADGSAKSPTVTSKRKRSDAEVAAIKRQAAAQSKQMRQAKSYQKFVRNQRKP